MPLRVLIVPDKFKGTLTAQAAAASIRLGWSEARPADPLALLPMSDGGDGFGEVLATLRPVQTRRAQTVDAAHRPHQTRWWWDEATQTALIESAAVIGLALLPPKACHPFDLDTFGLGAVLLAANQARHCLLGIGGSATNDGGFGMARALGWAFLDRKGAAMARWTDLVHLARIVPPPAPPAGFETTVAVDVQNPLLGPSGATRVYGPQKGLSPPDFSMAEACLARLAEVVHAELGIDAAAEPGTGAAGGLGFGLRCFLQARLAPGFGIFAEWARLEERIRASDLVVTGEGAIDESTLMGKGVGEIARLSARCGVPCLGLAGTLSPSVQSVGGFTRLYGIVPSLASPDEAMQNAAPCLRQLAKQAAEEWGHP